MACKWSAEEGGSGQWLTASRTSRSASSETVRSGRCGGGDLRWPEVGEELGSSLGAFGDACVDGDGDGDEAELGGASERQGEHGGRDYVGGTATAASAMARRGREREPGGNEVSGRSSGRRGRRPDPLEARAASRRRRGARGGVAVSLLCLLAEVGDDWHGAGLGRPGGLASWAATGEAR